MIDLDDFVQKFKVDIVKNFGSPIYGTNLYKKSRKMYRLHFLIAIELENILKKYMFDVYDLVQYKTLKWNDEYILICFKINENKLNDIEALFKLKGLQI